MFSDTLWLLLPPHSLRSFSPPGRWEAPGRGCVPRTVCSVQIRPLQQEPRALSCSALLWRGGGGAAAGLDLEGGVGTFKRPRWGNRRTRHRRWRQHIAADSPKQPGVVEKKKKKVVEMPLNVFHKPKKPKSWQHSWICCWKLQLICPTLCYVRESLIYNTKVIFLPAQRHGALTTLV